MGKVKDTLYCANSLYDFYMEKRLEGLPLELIPEVESYMRRHWIEYLLFLDIMDATRFAEEIMNDKNCQRDFLMYKIHQNIENPNIGLILSGIYDYIEAHVPELETEEYMDWRYGEPF